MPTLMPLRPYLFLLASAVLLAVPSGLALPIPTSYPDEPACTVRSIEKYPAQFENVAASPVSDLLAFTELDSKGVYQLYMTKNGGNEKRCVSCAQKGGAPPLDRNKPMISWHPSGRWLVVGVEENKHDNMWMPKAWQRGLIQSGIWLNIWITTPEADAWYQVTDFQNAKSGPSNGFVGISFTPDGRKAVWAEIVDGNIFANHFGIWKLYMADFQVSGNGAPRLVNKRDITPAGARWVEPGNFAPDGRRILISADVGMKDAQGQDQFILDTTTGQLQNLTNSPTVWDEHGLFSADGSKIIFMSSLPYRDTPNSYKVTSLRTEFLMMNADGSHLQQVSHFNVPGYSESQAKGTVAAVAGFQEGGSGLFSTVMGPNFTKSNWTIRFAGRCGGQASERARPRVEP